ncbi:MAG TPA: DUF4097 family beta strand repeat-containing protein [Blastocatellia bacterium]|nr:DUF4097 family beta strand repeat-containing protein [Blastocatellia bacterium]
MASGRRKGKGLLLIGLLLLAAGLVFFFIPDGAGLAELFMRLWPVFLICAGVVRVMGYAIERNPRSPVGGMFLIIIGVLFFASRFHSDLNAIQIYGRYWLVLLLIFAAVELLRFYSHRHTEGPPPRLFTAWRLVVIALIIASGVVANRVSTHPSVLSALRLPGLLGSLRDSVVGETYNFTDSPVVAAQAGPGTKIIIDNSYGNVKVTGGSPFVRATLSKGVRAWSEADARKISEQIRLQITPTSEGLRVSTNRDEISQQFTTDIQVEVPYSVLLSITDSYGSVSASGIQGDLSVKAAYGKADVSNITGNVNLGLSYSDADASNITGNLKISGAKRVRVSGIGGRLELGANHGTVELRSVTGPADINAPFSRISAQDLGGAASIKTEHGSIKVLRALDLSITAPHSNVRAESISGDLKIFSSNSDIQLKSIAGEAIIAAERSSVSGDDLRGAIDVETSHGDVSIKSFYEGVRVVTSYRNVSLVAATEPVGDIVVDNSHGEIKLVLPQSSRFQIDASSDNGQVKQTGFTGISQSSRGSLLAVQGTDGPFIKLKTTYKDITIQASNSRQAQAGRVVDRPGF